MIAHGPAVTIREVRVVDLPSYLESHLASPGQHFLPITPRRAQSQSRNPFARPDDAGLIVAYDGDELVGYMGLMPGPIRGLEEGARVHWVTTLYVHRSHRSRGVAAALVERSLELGVDIGVAGSIAAPARALFVRAGFREAGPLQLAVVNLRRLLPARADGAWPLLGPVLRALYYRLVGGARPPAEPDGGDGVAARLAALPALRPVAGQVNFAWGREGLAWMAGDPWLNQGDPPLPLPYHFGGTTHIAYRLLDFAGGGPDPALVLVSVAQTDRGTRVKWVDELGAPALAALVFRGLFGLAAVSSADRIELPPELAAEVERLPLRSRVVERVPRWLLWHPAGPSSPLARAGGALEPGVADGDAGFY